MNVLLVATSSAVGTSFCLLPSAVQSVNKIQPMPIGRNLLVHCEFMLLVLNSTPDGTEFQSSLEMAYIAFCYLCQLPCFKKHSCRALSQPHRLIFLFCLRNTTYSFVSVSTNVGIQGTLCHFRLYLICTKVQSKLSTFVGVTMPSNSLLISILNIILNYTR